MNDNSSFARLRRAFEIVCFNILLLTIFFLVFEGVLRLVRSDMHSINRLRLSFSYHEMFTSTPIASKFVNIEPVYSVTTRRVTPTNPKEGQRLFMFGGSTTLGLNDPNNPEMSDSTTIASHLAAILNEKGNSIQVENYGVGSFRSSEEVSKLIKLLRAGQRPDYVVFYDGYNDTEFAIRGQAIHDYMRPAIDLLNPYISAEYCEKALRQFEIYKLLDSFPLFQGTIRGVVFRIFDRSRSVVKEGYDSKFKIDADLPQSIQETDSLCVSNYVANIRVVRSLAKEFGFKAVFVLQPMIYFKTPLSPEEHNILANLPDSLKHRTPELYRLIEGALQGSSDFFVVTDIFEGVASPIYIDQGHMLSTGNRLVANRLSTIMSSVISKRE